MEERARDGGRGRGWSKGKGVEQGEEGWWDSLLLVFSFR